MNLTNHFTTPEPQNLNIDKLYSIYELKCTNFEAHLRVPFESDVEDY